MIERLRDHFQHVFVHRCSCTRSGRAWRVILRKYYKLRGMGYKR